MSVTGTTNTVTTYSAPSATSIANEPALCPIGIPLALLYFGVPSAVFTASILGVLPWMIRRGVSSFIVLNVTFGVPLALMLGAAVLAYHLEGRPWSWPAFRDRMRLGRPTKRGWLLTVALCAFVLVAHYLTDWTTPFLSRVHLYTPPGEFESFERQMFGGGGQFLGIQLAGQWWLLGYYLVMLLVFNILGEELWWRGYILPRQELANGGSAWIVNGTLWAAFHIFYHATLLSFVAMLPGTLALALVAQRTRNSWPGIIGHTVMNSSVPLMILAGILGRG